VHLEEPAFFVPNEDFQLFEIARLPVSQASFLKPKGIRWSHLTANKELS